MESIAEHVYTPSELNREVKLHLEAGFPRILLEAEISNLARPASGHLYFTLKDEKAQVRCAMFRSAASRTHMRVENGMNVLARGRLSLYEQRGEYQFIVDGLQDAGEGLLQRRFEELKKKLDADGLFRPEHKQAIPAYPARIGLITSPGGAAVRDLLQVLARRWPIAEIRLYPVLVQGTEAPAEICTAVEAANRHRWAETLIMGRGGGSLEDLMAFNDEAVARAVFASKIPIVCAVGHETDFSICDFVADLRAPTPSAAAELATPDQEVLKRAFLRTQRQLELRIRDRLQRDSQRLDHAGHRLRQQHPAVRLSEKSRRLESISRTLRSSMNRLLAEQSLKTGSLARRLESSAPDRRIVELSARTSAASRSIGKAMRNFLDLRKARLSDLARTLHAVSPLETMGRGYAIITDAETGAVISGIAQVQASARVKTRLKDGSFDSTVNAVHPE